MVYFDVSLTTERQDHLKTLPVYAISALIALGGCAAHMRGATEGKAPGRNTGQAEGTLADPALQQETLSMILFTDDALSHGARCDDRKIVKKEVVNKAAGSWTERWTLERCGTALRYRVFYTSGARGTAYFTVKLEK